MKHSAAGRIGRQCQAFPSAKAISPPLQAPRRTAQKLRLQLSYRADGAPDVGGTDNGRWGFLPLSPPAASESSPSHNIRGQAENGTVPEHVASARAWIAAWTATQKIAQTPVVPENVASARAWIAAWKSTAQVSSDSPEIEALRREVEKLRALLSASEAAAQAAEMKLRHAGAEREDIALSLAQQTFAAADFRKQRDSVVHALSSLQEHIQAFLTVQAAAPQQHQHQQAAVRAQGSTEVSPAAAAAVATKPSKLPAGFTNKNRYWVPEHLQSKFLQVVAERQAAMQKTKGFVALTVSNSADLKEQSVVEVSSSWASVPDWEAWSGGREVQRHQLPTGVMQFPPKRGEGFPEDYTPFKDLAAEPPNAKY